MKLNSDEEFEQFVEIAVMLKYYKSKGVPIPADVRDMIERNRNNGEVYRTLYDIIHE